MLAAAAMLLAPAAAVAGLYEAHVMEVGAALELQPNGHFRYQLDYGAVSEHAEGDWTFDGTNLRLTTRPSPRLPAFELVRDDPAPVGELTINLEAPGLGSNYRLDALATDASGEKGLVTTNGEGRVDLGGHTLVAVDPLVPVYGIVGGHFPLSEERGHRLLLRFHANDLGTAAFDAQRLSVTGSDIVLSRFGREIRFIRVRP